ncbi:orexin receptor type [Plakobranchus ocellatus]|uniref:Orexin receptor type n=1 Tax=Plakobranchus ocellatus TaxID=259542 RepID=A0AAV3ZN74_9GAST|nr:orexin receptor type [Plakobranchus ocellatus]
MSGDNSTAVTLTPDSGNRSEVDWSHCNHHLRHRYNIVIVIIATTIIIVTSNIIIVILPRSLHGTCSYPQHLMDEIWLYLELTPLEWVISCLYVLVFITGVGGNFLVCYAVWRNKYLRTITNCFLTNLAVADFLTIVFCLPPSFAQNILETWFLGRALCKIVKYLQVSLEPAKLQWTTWVLGGFRDTSNA